MTSSPQKPKEQNSQINIKKATVTVGKTKQTSSRNKTIRKGEEASQTENVTSSCSRVGYGSNQSSKALNLASLKGVALNLNAQLDSADEFP